MAVSVQPANVSDYLTQFASLQAGRWQYDRIWQEVGDYLAMRRDFTITRQPNQLRPRRVASSVGLNANSRLAAFILAWAVDYTRPFLLPNVKHGLVAAGRDTELSPAAMDYLAGLEWQVFDHIMLPKAQFMQRLGSALKEFCAYGVLVMWCGRKRGFGPYFNTRPIQSCWFSENEEGVIDTLYYRMMLPKYRVLKRWPNANYSPNFNTGRTDEQDFCTVLHAVKPRDGGQRGAVAQGKPFASVMILEEQKLILEETGYDSFPYAVARYDPQPGQTYALGPGCLALPDIKVLNHIQLALERATELRGDPPLAVPARMFAKPIDRRPGGMNYFETMGVGLSSPDKAILKMDIAGDVIAPTQYIQYLTTNIEAAYFTDWMRLRDSGDMTAAEVNDRRDMQLRGMASLVANLELAMGHLGDRAQDILQEEGMIAPPPADLAGVNVDWEYAGPLMISQLRGNAQTALQMINARGLVNNQDPAAAEAVDLEEQLRIVAESLGTPTRGMNSRAEVAAARAARNRQMAQAATVQKMQQLAGAAKDGTASVANLVDAHSQAQAANDARQGASPGGGAPGAAFAPASPFAQPIAA